MLSIVLDNPGSVSVRDTAEPIPTAGEALVRIHRVGVCGSDLHAYKGDQPYLSYPRILGHELGVEVVEAPENARGIRAGDRCAVQPYLHCGRCVACRRGRTNCCESLRTLGVHTDGGMQELFAIPVEYLHPSRSLSLDQLALVETLCIGAHAVRRGQPESGENTLVIGAGPIGLGVMLFAAAAAAKVAAMDASPARLEDAARRAPLHATIPAGESAAEAIRDAFGGELPTLIFDATGNPRSMMAAPGFLANSGRIVYVGLCQADITFSDLEFHRKEMTLLATRNATAEDFRHVIDSVESGRVDTRPWITHRAPARQAPAEFPRWTDPESGVLKAIVEF